MAAVVVAIMNTTIKLSLFGIFSVLGLLVGCSSEVDGSDKNTALTPSSSSSSGDKTQESSDPNVGFWTAGPVNCGGQFDIAYGFALCSTKKVSGVEAVASPKLGSFRWLAEGSYSQSGSKLTLTLKRTVVDPAPIRGDVNNATLTLERKGDTFVVVDANEMPECSGLVLKKTESVTDADCESDSSSGDGCTADVDCGSGKRCERSTGRCLTKLGG